MRNPLDPDFINYIYRLQRRQMIKDNCLFWGVFLLILAGTLLLAWKG